MAKSPNSNDSSGAADNGDSWEAEIFEQQVNGRYGSVSKVTGDEAKPRSKSKPRSKRKKSDDLIPVPVKDRKGSGDLTILAGQSLAKGRP